MGAIAEGKLLGAARRRELILTRGTEAYRPAVATSQDEQRKADADQQSGRSQMSLHRTFKPSERRASRMIGAAG